MVLLDTFLLYKKVIYKDVATLSGAFPREDLI